MALTQAQATALGNTLDTVWPPFDPQGRTFRAALSAAILRARASVWPAGDKTAYADIAALALATSLYVEMLKGRENDPYADRWASALTRTNRMLAEKVGYKGQTVDQVTAEARQTHAVVEIGVILAILAVVAAAITYIVVAYFLITNAAQVVDNELSRRAEERQLTKSQAEAERVIGQHFDAEQKAGHAIDWTDAELSYLTALEQQQADLVHGLTSTQRSPSDSVWGQPWPYLVITGVALTAVGVTYRVEIKRWLDRHLGG